MTTRTRILTVLGTLGWLALSQPAIATEQKRTKADNSAINERDRKEHELTADQQSNKKSDTELTAEIRRGIVAHKDLSTYAHNVKIIAVNGEVTLKGPVRSQSEINTIMQIAQECAHSMNVKNEMQVARSE